MELDTKRTRQLLNNFELTELFIEELGWDRLKIGQTVTVDGTCYSLSPVAEKRGVQIFECSANSIPPYPLRQKIDRQLRKLAHEHLIIFTDTNQTTQIWQWVARQQGKPTAYREYAFHRGDSADFLIQRLNGIAFPLSAEEGLDITGVTKALRDSLDRERVTKRFYDLFKAEHDAFKKFLKDIPVESDQRWYASVMLNRLMFIYFIQSKGFLNGDTDYLKSKLAECEQRAKDRFYRDFLCPLFFQGFAEPESKRSAKTNALLGTVPYLNGGIFQEHQLEKAHGKKIKIPDSAFHRLFAFFDNYRWHLDERPLRNQNEINPDILGYIFEKYINQKQMGAYYTKEDITEYISKNTIIPNLFDAARPKCRIAFEGEHSIWGLLRADPDRYIYPAVLKGVDLPLPDEIAVGIDDVAKRTEWNKAAPEEYAQPTEIWREVVARRQRYEEIKAKIEAGDVREINDLITYNLNIRQFAQDVIQDCEGPELLRAFWKAIEGVTVLDPTCGSGAFLFAALNILEPLYEACLDRMEAFVEELDRFSDKHHPEKFSDFRKVLARIEEHPNRKYYIFKSIIIKNLYGVDIMEEAVEICKLRLFLKLVAQVDKNTSKPNWGIEPLPDIDFNIRAGNSLVGYATLEQTKAAVTGKLDFDKAWDKIEMKAADLQQRFDVFRATQLEGEGTVPSEHKEAVQTRLKALNDELNLYLAKEYGVKSEKPKAFAKWHDSHKPFHWFVEFHGIMREGGFAAAIGNPPYFDMKQGIDYATRNYTTLSTGNLYPLLIENSISLVQDGGRLGFIVPVSSISTEGYSPLQKLILPLPNHVSSFDDRPSRLFDGLEHIRLTIHLIENRYDLAPSEPKVTKCHRWSSVERPSLFEILEFEAVETSYLSGCIPKLSDASEHSVLRKIWADRRQLGSWASPSGRHRVYYSRKMAAFLQVLDFVPEVFDGQGNLRPPSELKYLRFSQPTESSAAFCVLNSNLFRWFVNVFSDVRHVNKREVEGFPCDLQRLISNYGEEICGLAKELSASLRDTSEYRNMRFKHDHLRVQCIVPRFSKPIIDRIDRILALHYALTDKELDFIVNHDIKYRVGVSS